MMVPSVTNGVLKLTKKTNYLTQGDHTQNYMMSQLQNTLGGRAA